MTTSTATPRLTYLTSDGSTVNFTFNFDIADQNSIAVYVGTTLKTLTTDYTVSFDSGTSGTGTVTLNSAPAANTRVYLIRDTYNVRSTDFAQGGAFLAETINNELDRITQGIQDVDNIVASKVIRVAEPTVETANLNLPAAATRANKVLAFDGSGNVNATGTITVTSVTGDLIGNVTASSGTSTFNDLIVSGDLTVNGTTTTLNTSTLDVEDNIITLNSNVSGAPAVNAGIEINRGSSPDKSFIWDEAADKWTIGTETLVAGTVQANVTGNLTGNVTGDVLGGVTGNVTGNLTGNVTGDLNTGNLTIIDNNITATQSNDDINLITNGTGNINVDSAKIINLATPTAGTDAANKNYVDTRTDFGNISISGNAITSTNANGNISITPNGTGSIILDGLYWPQTDGAANTTLKTDGAGNLSWGTSAVLGIDVVGDDSTGTHINDGETIKIAGASNITTAMSGDTLTITGPNLANYAQKTDKAITIVGDDSTGTDITIGETFKIAGGSNITTSVTGDTLTINGSNPAQGITIVGDDSTGTQIADGETVKIAGGNNITTAMSGDTLTITGSKIIDVNEISSGDSSAIQINDAVNISGALTVQGSIYGQTIQGLQVDGNISIQPNGTGDVILSADTVKFGDANQGAILTTNGTGTLYINTASGGSIRLFDGANANIELIPNGTGDVYLTADTIRVGDSNTDAVITTNGTGDLILNTNSGTNSGSITIADGVNGNITLAPNGVGNIIAGSLRINGTTLSSDDSSKITLDENVDISGTLNAKTIVTNDLISGDSTAIQVLDGLGVSGDLSVTGDITTADSLQFDTAAAETVATGKLYYSSAYGTLAHGLSDGTELIDGVDLVTYVTNAEATTLTKGEVVYIFGASGDRPSVKRADNSGDPTSSKTLGIVKNNITAGSAGYVVTQGIITGLNTATYTAGDVLWLSTGGAFTATKPTHPAHLVFVGVVLRANAGNGLVYVKPQNGYELDELHDVNAGTAVANDVLKYDGSAWVNHPGTITVVGDDSTGTTLNLGETVKIAGAGTITTAVSGDTLTISASAVDIVNDTTPQLGGNLDVNGYSITSTSNADINISPNGTGNVNLNADTVRVGDSSGTAYITTDTGVTDLHIGTRGTTTASYIKIERVGTFPTVEDITLHTLGGRNILKSGEVVIGDGGADADLTTNGPNSLTISTNSTTNSGTIEIIQGVNGNISITPNGTGSVVLDGLNWPQSDGSANYVLKTNGSGQLSWVAQTVDTNTTYGISAETATGGTNLRLTGSDSSTDNVKLAEGTGITVTRTDADTITIASTVTDTNTTYSISAETATGGANLRLTDSGATTDDVKIASGTNITVSRTDASTITIDGPSIPNVFNTIAIAGQSSVVADSTSDTLTLVAGTNVTLTTDATTDTITIAATGSSGISDIVQDTTPQLGGSLDVNGQIITSTSNGNIELQPNGTGDVYLTADTVRVGDSNANATITTNGTGDLILNTNSGTNSGSITIADAANGNISLVVDGTGKVILGDDFTAANLDNYTNTSNSFPAFGDIATIKSNLMFTSTLAVPNITSFADRHFNNTIYSYGKADSSATTYNNNSFRWGNTALSLFDMNGATADSTVTGSRAAAIRGMAISTAFKNSGGGTKTTPNQVGLTAFNEIQEGHGGDLTVVNQMGVRIGNSVRANTGEFSRITNSIGFIADTITTAGTGANNTNRFVTNEYGFYDAPSTSSSLVTNHYGFYVHTGAAATNKYAFYSADDTYLSRIGTLERYNEKINTLTSSSTITVDADLAPVHKVTLGINTQIGITGLSTGQTVTIIIVQDGTGGRTASFTSDTSTAVKFAGGTPTLSTAANAIDIVTVFNDGTNLYGNIAKAYA